MGCRSGGALSDRDRSPADEDPAVLRAALARVQEAARQSLSHLRGDQDYSREPEDSVRDVVSVTNQVALEQELDIIRRSLREKERLIEATATQCRHLEDQLEDQHQAYDGLRQDLERKKLSLADAREQVERVNRERQEMEERYRALQISANPGAVTDRSPGKPGSGNPGSGRRFVGGLLAGVLLAAAALGLWAWLQPLDHPLAPESRMTGVQDASPPAPESRPASLNQRIPTSDMDAGPIAAAVQPQPVALGSVRDRLSDGSTGPLMLKLPGGLFTMGKQLALPDEDEGPAHDVRLGEFLIGATEVTFEEYDRFARATGRRLPGDFGWGRGTRPVVDITWADARAYADWLSRRTGKGYRLPSEAEWEYAAGAGQRSFFWWGHKVEPGRAVCFDCGTLWDNRSSAPVASLDANPFGLYDTAGNVMEWVEDCYHPSYEGAPSDGRPWIGESCGFRVARGGAFNKPARSMRTTARQHFAADTRINAIGLRLARDE